MLLERTKKISEACYRNLNGKNPIAKVTNSKCCHPYINDIGRALLDYTRISQLLRCQTGYQKTSPQFHIKIFQFKKKKILHYYNN
jgi:hypothetical protein